MKKRIIILISAIIIALSFTVSFTLEAVLAQDKYILGDTGFAMSFPSNYQVVTRDNVDESLSLYDITKEELLEIYESNNIYVDAWSDDIIAQVTVIIMNVNDSNFSETDDSVLLHYLELNKAAYSNYGIVVEDYGLYRSAMTKYWKLYYYNKAQDYNIQSIQYFTVHEGKSLAIKLETLIEQDFSDLDRELQLIVDSIEYVDSNVTIENDNSAATEITKASTETTKASIESSKASTEETTTVSDKKNKDTSSKDKDTENVYVSKNTSKDDNDIFARIFITVFLSAIMFVPIFIIRFVIVKEPLDSLKARIIGIVYGVIAAIVLAVVGVMFDINISVVGAPVIWFLSGKILSYEKKTESQKEAMRMDAKLESGKYCITCGNKLEKFDKFCDKCGSRVESQEW